MAGQKDILPPGINSIKFPIYLHLVTTNDALRGKALDSNEENY